MKYVVGCYLDGETEMALFNQNPTADADQEYMAILSGVKNDSSCLLYIYILSTLKR